MVTVAVLKLTVMPAGGVSHGSLFGTLVHILSAEWVWRVRCQEHMSPPALLRAEDFGSLGALESRWREEEQTMLRYLAGLSSGDLRGGVSYTNTRGLTFTTPLWQILAHVVNHGTQFRGEAGVLLTRYGQSPGDLDLIYYVRSVR